MRHYRWQPGDTPPRAGWTVRIIPDSLGGSSSPDPRAEAEIGADEAERIARRFLEARLSQLPPEASGALGGSSGFLPVLHVVDGATGVRFNPRPYTPFVRDLPSLDEVWIAFVQRFPLVLDGPSSAVVVRKATGEVLYFGPA